MRAAQWSPARCRPRRCRTAASWLGHARYLFHESPTRAPDLIAEEPADAETDDQPVAADGEPGYVTPVPAVNACGGMLTLGTCSWRPAAGRVDHQAVIRDHGLSHHKVQAREEDVFERLRRHDDVIPWQNGPAISDLQPLLPGATGCN